MKKRYLNLFHLNPPTWSLFWEYIANIFYAIILVRLPKKVLWVLTVLAAIALLYEAKQSTHLSVGFPFRDSYNWLADPLIVILYFPLLIMLGAGVLTHKTTHAICRFSGKISYPLT